jgi:hypothetical protein
MTTKTTNRDMVTCTKSKKKNSHLCAGKRSLVVTTSRHIISNCITSISTTVGIIEGIAGAALSPHVQITFIVVLGVETTLVALVVEDRVEVGSFTGEIEGGRVANLQRDGDEES